MFGIGRKQEEREQELISKQTTIERYSQKFSEMTDKMHWLCQETETGLTDMEKNQSELDQQLTRVMESVNKAAEETKQQKERSEKLSEQVKELAEEAEKSELTYQQMVEQIGSQEQELREAMEDTRELDFPAELVSQTAMELKQEMEEIKERISNLEELGRQMGILSLNAAIEAGKMGESGREFVEAAEDVRGLSGQYHQTAAFLTKQIVRMEERLTKTEEELADLRQKRKEKNIHLEAKAGELTTYISKLEHSEIQKLIPQIQALTECMEQSVSSEEDSIRRYEAVSEAIEQAGKTFQKQQDEAMESLRGKAKEAEEWEQEMA